MRIAINMSLDQLAERIGAGATQAQAIELRDLLIEEGWNDKQTTDLPEDLWERMVDAALEAAQQARPHRR